MEAKHHAWSGKQKNLVYSRKQLFTLAEEDGDFYLSSDLESPIFAVSWTTVVLYILDLEKLPMNHGFRMSEN